METQSPLGDGTTNLLVRPILTQKSPLHLPRIKDNKTIRVADEDAPEDYRFQQSIFLGHQGVFPGACWRREGHLLDVE